MLSDAETTDARRYLGYPVHGAANAGNMGWQFYRGYGAMEWRLANLSASEEGVLRQYLGTLSVLEQAIPGSGPGLDTGSAAGFVRNAAEVSERVRLFDDWRRRFCAFLGVPPGPGLVAAGTVLGWWCDGRGGAAGPVQPGDGDGGAAVGSAARRVSGVRAGGAAGDGAAGVADVGGVRPGGPGVSAAAGVLPDDGGLPGWSILLPRTPVGIAGSDLVQDERGRRYVVRSAELTELGWRLSARQVGI